MKTAQEGELASPVQAYLEAIHAELSGVRDGQVATYIPELAKANPDWFGLCLVTATGSIYEAGDSRQPFTIQSISKPFVYGLALEDNGRPQVLAKVGLEPTGDAFNSISLEPGTGRPRNPMINAGAIATTSLIAGSTPSVRLRRLVDMMSQYAGRELELDEAVYRSESQTGHRNRAIGHMLRNFDILTEDPIPAVELYFQQCSVSVTCRDLGVMAATLANHGVNPLTGRQAIRGEYVESVLSVMGSCGMYDYAGEWIYNIGMPAKSGVAGGIIAVLPGQLGIGVFSPPLDSRGNSVRGIRACSTLSRHENLHLLNPPIAAPSAIRLQFTGAQLNSSRVRTARESQVLHQHGAAIRVYQLQGDLAFATAESVVRDVISNAPGLHHLVLDLRRVFSLNESACRLFCELLVALAGRGHNVIFTHTEHLPLLRRYMKIRLHGPQQDMFRALQDNDLALELCEDRLLETALPGRRIEDAVPVARYELCEEFTPEQVQQLSNHLERRTYQQSEVIINVGDEAREMFFLARGGVSVFVPLGSGARKRLATFSAGMAFGEMALIDRAPRSAIIVADSTVECDVLSVENLERLGAAQPGIKIKLLENLNLSLCRRLRKANRELSLLD